MNNVLNDILNDKHFPEGSAWERRNFQENDIIVAEGDDGGSLFFIEQGKLRVAGNIELEKQKHIQAGIWELEAGDIFGELALYESQLRTASVRAISDGTLVEINGKKLAFIWMHTLPGVIYFTRICLKF